jgi:putative ABC transport system substrate-binding protein
MRRRDFLGLLGGVTAAWPLAARAQALPVVGFLNGQSAGSFAPIVIAFREGLSELGYVEGRNVAIEYRWAEGRPERLPAFAAELVQLKVAVIAATGGNNSALAAKAATKVIPIVFTSGGDPRKQGLVETINRPGGNVTGVSWYSGELGPKRLALLYELVPKAKTFALLINPVNPESTGQADQLQEVARRLGLALIVLQASSVAEIDLVFATMAERGVHALVIAGDPFFINIGSQIWVRAARHAIPTIYVNREAAGTEGLISYGNSLVDVYHRAGAQTGRLLNGANPAELPVDQSTKFDLTINLRAAKALGLEVPPSVLARADEVIE